MNPRAFCGCGWRRVVLVGVLVVSSLASSAARAAWTVFPTLTNPANPNQTALVAEQIFPTGPTGANLDYEFLVLNTSASGVPPISGFFLGTPNQTNLNGLLSLGNLRFASAPGGADPTVFPNVPTPVFGNLPFSASNGVAWGFQEFDDRPTPSGLPQNFYLVRWYNIPGTPTIPIGFYARFDLFTPTKPVPNGGAPDPLGPTSLVGFDDGLGNIVFEQSPTVLESATEDTSIPPGFTTGQLISVPEPSSVVMMGFGMAGATWMGALIRRARRPRSN